MPMQLPPTGSPQPPPHQASRMLPPGAGAVMADPTQLPNNIINALYSCAASEINQQKIKDLYAETFPPTTPP